MSVLMTTLAVASLATAQYPDALDHLRAGDVVPQVGLLLDRSGSMGWGDAASDCTWFAQACPGGHPDSLWGWNYCRPDCPCEDYKGDCDSDAECQSGYCAHDVGTRYGQGSSMDVCEPNPNGNPSVATTILDKSQQMKAALVGCRSADDGIIDKWASRVNFSVYEFGSSTALKVPFDSDKASLEAGIMAIPASGATYMTRGIHDHAKYFQNYFTGDNSLGCRPNFLVMLSDGNPNGGATTFQLDCSAPVESKYVSSSQPWWGSDYINRNEDILCRVPGEQDIKTYTIGFGQPGDFSPTNLQNIADYGDGDYYYASDREQLNAAFEQIISSIVSRSALFFAPIAVQADSLFSGNYAYAASFKPQEGGPWRGTVKKYCVVPPLATNGSYDVSVDTCLFVSPDGTTLETNPRATDLWTGDRTVAADIGGAGDVVIRQLGTVAGGNPVAPYWGHRKIVSWRAGSSGYVSVDPSNWSASDSQTNGCNHKRLLNRLHGYTYDADCTTGDPISVDAWPLGDPVDFAPVLLTYGPCHDAQEIAIPGNCYVAVGMNDGMLHIFDSADGSETSALIPAEVWGNNGISASGLGEIQNQPNLSRTHRYFVDGVPRLYHVDADADGVIDASETAQLVFGLGRGGRAYYKMDVSKLASGALSSQDNAVYPLTFQPGTALQELQDTWAAPWMGRLRQTQGLFDVAVFPSGHIANFDFQLGTPEVPYVASTPRPDFNNPNNVSCAGAGGLAAMNGQPDSWCQASWFNNCASSGACYDAGGTPLDLFTTVRAVHPTYQAGAVRLSFASFDIDPNDVIRIEDMSGAVVGEYSGQQLSNSFTPWVYGDHLVIRLITDGVDTSHQGFIINALEWVAADGSAQSASQGPGRYSNFRLGVDHRPTIFVADLARWNSSAPKAFTDSVDGGGLIMRFTNDCNGIDSDRCIDANDSPDLQHMVCPISAEVSAYAEADELRALYWGDECGQIFKAWTPDGGDLWKVKRLVNLNGGQIAVDQNHRKLFRRLDLVLSGCAGERAVGVYFGTGNVQGPTSKSDLQDAAVTNGQDIVGVIWDIDRLPSGLTEADLEDVTAGTALTATQMLQQGKYGWRVDLADNERMLRDPLVFDSVAYFKSFEPTTAAAECGGSSGIDRIYALNNCTGEAVRDTDGDGVLNPASEREVWSGETEVGGGLFFYTPKDSPVLVSHADISQRQSGQLNTRQRSRPGLYLWREY